MKKKMTYDHGTGEIELRLEAVSGSVRAVARRADGGPGPCDWQITHAPSGLAFAKDLSTPSKLDVRGARWYFCAGWEQH